MSEFDTNAAAGPLFPESTPSEIDESVMFPTSDHPAPSPEHPLDKTVPAGMVPAHAKAPDEAPAEASSARSSLDSALPVIGEGEGMVAAAPKHASTPAPAVTAGETPAPAAQAPVFAGHESFDVGTPELPEKRRRRWPTVVLALLVLLTGAYLAGVVYFMNRFLPNTTLNGEDVSLKTVDEVAQAHTDSVSNFSFAVTGDDIELTIGASDIGAAYDGGAFARKAHGQQKPWTWPLEMSQSHSLSVEQRMTYDAARFEDVVGSAIDAHNKDAKKSEDAKIDFDDKAKRYKVTSEVQGNVVDKQEAIKLAKAAIDAKEASVTLGEDLYLKPEVTSDDEKLNAAVDKVNASFGATQKLVTHGTEVATVGEDLLQKWVKLEDDLSVSFDDAACTTWAQGDLSAKLDTIGSSRSFALPDGRSVSVSGGTYGWCCDGAAIAADIADHVREGTSGEVEVSWKVEAAKWNPGGQEWGDKFVEIDLGAQHVKLFDGDKVAWESDCVTGKTADGHNTPTGVYYINSNMQSGNVELRGEIDPKTHEPEYISYVKYWMPFIDNGYALHDADWRSSFGGDIYKNDGSHGCVNLPPDKAADLYGMVGVGTVVVVHS